MTRSPLDCLIVGQGLAGTALAWQARAVGFHFLVVDRGDSATASRAAAGLVTPVTGRRVVKSERFDEFHSAAVAFYRRVEAELGETFYHDTPMVRLFATDRERAVYESRADAEFRGWTRPLHPPVNPAWFTGRLDGFEMPRAGRLDVNRYLDASRGFLAQEGRFRLAPLVPQDLSFDPASVSVPSLGVSARRVVFCTGFDPGHPWYRPAWYNAAKGEILTIRVPGLGENRVVNRGVWISPAGDGAFHAGATYEWDDLSPTPTAEGRRKLEARLGEFLRLPFEVIDHRAGVRPISADRHPILGFHPAEPRVGCFTGLGSKGVLAAPFLAAQLLSAMTGVSSLDSDFDVRRFPSG